VSSSLFLLSQFSRGTVQHSVISISSPYFSLPLIVSIALKLLQGPVRRWLVSLFLNDVNVGHILKAVEELGLAGADVPLHEDSEGTSHAAQYTPHNNSRCHQEITRSGRARETLLGGLYMAFIYFLNYSLQYNTHIHLTMGTRRKIT
jgi:hypothetical protein